MSDYTIHTAATAPQGAREALEGVQKQLGFVPNLMGVMAESPSTLKAYLNLMQLLGETSFSPIEEQVVALAVSHANGCTYCMAAHSAIAKSVGMSDDDLTALRDGGPLEDTALEALRAFTVDVVETRGWVSPAAQSAFFEAGYTRTHMLEVLLGVTMKTLSNYVNHTADTPLDEQFAPFAWSPTNASADAA